MAENKEYMIHQEDDGSIQISEDVLDGEQIVVGIFVAVRYG